MRRTIIDSEISSPASIPVFEKWKMKEEKKQSFALFTILRMRLIATFPFSVCNNNIFLFNRSAGWSCLLLFFHTINYWHSFLLLLMMSSIYLYLYIKMISSYAFNVFCVHCVYLSIYLPQCSSLHYNMNVNEKKIILFLCILTAYKWFDCLYELANKVCYKRTFCVIFFIFPLSILNSMQ